MEPFAGKAEGLVLPDDALRAYSQALKESADALFGDGDLVPSFEPPRRPEFGEFATNVAFALVRRARRAPQEVAQQLIADVASRSPQVNALFSDVVPTAGFINVRLRHELWQAAIVKILRDGESYGRGSHAGTRVSLEFGSANPTGPLLVVQGRALSIGDTLARTMRLRGYEVFTEWIINDAGGQVETLGRSVYARYRQQSDPEYPFPDDGYPAGYITQLASQIRERDGNRWESAPDTEAVDACGAFARDALVAGQRRTAERFGARYDLWQSERDLHESGRVSAAIERLKQLRLTYEHEGALFFRATQFDDDKDRVLIRADGRPTYYGADVAYHYEKLRRADRAIDILGPDHHGYIERLRGLAVALGFPGRLDVLIAQQVTLMRGNEQVSMSKRAGQLVTLDEVLDEVGVDAARFFFVMHATDTPLSFDLRLAVEQSNDNPVYYVQYGYARIASVLRKAELNDLSATVHPDLGPLEHGSEIALARRLYELPQLAQSVVDQLAPHRLTRYARDVASDFHQFYTECRILTEDSRLRHARLALCVAAQRVLSLVLDLLGVNAPETM